MALIVAPLLPAAPEPLPLRHEVNSDGGTSCGQRGVVLLVTIVRKLQAELQKLTWNEESRHGLLGMEIKAYPALFQLQ